ncbi:MAG: 50S ribosomal protein L15 [Pseudomonadota bacterium]
MKLNQLSDRPGARKSRMRVGRGIGSGKGKTAGRGVKGQKSRSGVAIKGFEGGQMPIHMRLPKRGFNKPNRLRFVEVNLGKLQAAIDSGKLDASAPITEKILVDTGVLRRARDGVRILAKGELTSAATFEVTGASKPAVEAIEKAGGTIKLSPPKKSDPAEGAATDKAGEPA